jgi:NTE family protein
MYQRYQWQAIRGRQHGIGRLLTCSRFIFLWPLILISGLASCTAHYSVNDAIESTESVQRYSLLKETISNRSDELVVYLAFSGGGTRAAAFSYGVLKKLAETHITANDQPKRFIDEVDVISSVSGGSFTAAYYGLFGDKIFEDFEQKFLKKNVQAELKRQILSPLNWFKLGSAYYSRSDLAADYYDKLLFEKKTFQEIANSEGPLIVINATNAALGVQFSFTGSQFAPICADLMTYPVSRAVTASSAVPGVFTSIILKNHAGKCDYQSPEWLEEALLEGSTNTRRYHLAKALKSYLDAKKQPYIHLLDGGLVDNLGTRLIINTTLKEVDHWKILQDRDLEEVRKVIVIAVNAQTEGEPKFNKRDYSIPIIDSMGAATSVPLKNYSFETMELLKENLEDFAEAATESRCLETRHGNGINYSCAVKAYLIEVNFDKLERTPERTHLQNLPTSFKLEPDDVDRLVAAAAELLSSSEVFQELISELKN